MEIQAFEFRSVRRFLRYPVLLRNQVQVDYELTKYLCVRSHACIIIVWCIVDFAEDESNWVVAAPVVGEVGMEREADWL